MDSKICVLGLGYIGLPTASMFATHGFSVIGVDINESVIHTINGGGIHIYETGLDELVKEAIHSGNLVARLIPEPADVFIIAVPTPITKDKRADLDAVKAASESIVPYIKKGNLVILESTVPPGTTKELVQPILERSGLNSGVDFQLVHAPERVLPGQILKELAQNDRILGGITLESAERAQNLYLSFVRGEIFLTDETSAEMVKLIENTYRDINIAFANELAQICDVLDIDVWEIINLANRHPRVKILQPGPGVGGHCIPVDPWFIFEKTPHLAKLIHQGRLINDSMPEYVCNKVLKFLSEISNPVIGILGVTYKENVDDIRESPSLDIIRHLRDHGCAVKVHDPYVYPEISVESIVTGSDCILLLVNHKEYAHLSPNALGEKMRTKHVFLTNASSSSSVWLMEGFKVFQLGNGKLWMV